MSRQGLRAALAGGLVLLSAAGWLAAGSAQAQDAPRQRYDFEDGAQGFSAVSFKDGQFGADAGATVTVAKDLVKVGQGALSYAFKAAPGSMHALTAEAKLPQPAEAMSLWVRSANRTSVFGSISESDGSSYELPFYVPANEWIQVSANLDEFRMGNDSTDENNKLDAAQVNNVTVVDIANLLINAPGDVGAGFAGARQIWLDDLQFTKERVAVTAGPVTVGTQKAVLLSNFETGVIDWLPVRVSIANSAPSFDIFPEAVTLRTLPEAAGPGAGKSPLEPGGKGLRASYKRGAQEVFGFVRAFEHQPLPASADRLHLSMNASQKSLFLIQVKEKDDSEYNYVVMPDDSVGWRTLDLPLSSLTLGDSSKDENNRLDPEQLKEVSVMDASAFGGLGAADVMLDLDAVYFTLK
jgi:hypothetical protein